MVGEGRGHRGALGVRVQGLVSRPPPALLAVAGAVLVAALVVGIALRRTPDLEREEASAWPTVGEGGRVALVVGNANYRELPEGRQPVGVRVDTEEMGAGLEALGYRLVGDRVWTDLDGAGLRAALVEFAKAARKAKAAVFYFAGDVVQMGGEKWMVPVDCGVEGAVDSFESQAVGLRSGVLEMLGEAQAVNKVLMVEGRVRNPFAEKLQGEGAESGVSVQTKSVTPMGDLGGGVYIACGAGLEKPAESAGVRHTSPFTGTLLEQMRMGASQNIDRLLEAVERALPAGQQAWVSRELRWDFSLGEVEKPALHAGYRAGQVWENGLGIRFRWCPAGEFQMGSTPEECTAFQRDGVVTRFEVQHSVKLTRGFWLGTHEVTQGEWEALMKRGLRDQVQRMLKNDAVFDFPSGKKPLRDVFGAVRDADPAGLVFVEDKDYPMYWVSWNDAVEFCQRLNERERVNGMLPPGWVYALPTEAQWEYACRAGSTGQLYEGEMEIKGRANAPALDPLAWYAGNSSVGYKGRGLVTDRWAEKQYEGGIAGPRQVGGKEPNAWGLSDMLGNVSEWCSDWVGEYGPTLKVDPPGPKTGRARVHRGGSWHDYAAYCRAANRSSDLAVMCDKFVGLRVALVRAP